MASDEAARAVPPFIPGLLVVCLLITISILIWWRNYMRRTHPSNFPGVDDWEFWEGDAREERALARLEKPKLWEVGVGWQDINETTFDETHWEKMSPLSAMSLTPEAPATGVTQTPPTQKPSFFSSRFRRPRASPSPAVVSHSSSEHLTPIPLQVSVLILMPSPDARTKSRSRELPAAPPSLPNPGLDSRLPGKVFEDDEEEDEGSPDVAFGVVVLPWRKTEDEAEQKGNSVT